MPTGKESIILVTGLSGAGKSKAMATLSDLGYFAVDNLPLALLPSFLDYTKTSPKRFERTAFLLDIDSKDRGFELFGIINRYPGLKDRLNLVFLDCSTMAIVRRYSETRRPHPAFNSETDKSLADTISRERDQLAVFKEAANLVIDTSEFTVHDLGRELQRFVDSTLKHSKRVVRVNFLSFGFKFGIPVDVDLAVDVRFLPNPHFVETLRAKTGLDQVVADFVLEKSDSKEFIALYVGLLDFLLPKYVYEGKSYINIGVGCTGGRHRSVVLAEAMAKMVGGEQYIVSVKHRDLGRQVPIT